MKIYYNQDTDELYIYLGKSTLPHMYCFMFAEHGFTNTLLKPKDLIYIGVL